VGVNCDGEEGEGFFGRLLLSDRSRQYFRRQQEQEVRQLGRLASADQADVDDEQGGEGEGEVDPECGRRPSSVVTAPAPSEKHNPLVR